LFLQERYDFFSRKQWYHLPVNKKNDTCINQSQEVLCCNNLSTIESHPSIELIMGPNKCEHIKPLFTVIRITVLNLSRMYSNSLNELISFIKYLPNLDALHVSSLSLTEKFNTYPPISADNTNKITKVNIEYIDELEKVQFAFELCPLMEYFEVKYCYVDYKSLLRFIFKLNNRNILHLRTIGLHIRKNVEGTIKELQNMINSEKLTNEFTIKSINDTVYIQ
jgi:hypothetical protein